MLNQITLRDYQELTLNNFIKRYTNRELKQENTVNCLPTGTGKSVIIFKMVSYLLSQNKKIGIIVPSIELLDNLERYFKINKLSMFVDKLGRDEPNHRKSIFIGVYKTFKNRLHQLPYIDVFIHDECHHIACDTWQELMIDGVWHEGFSATPARLDGKPLFGFTSIFEPYHIGWYMAKGHLCSNLVEYCAEQLVSISSTSIKDNLYDQWESAKGKLHGSIVDNWLKYANDGQTIIYATTIEHCHLIKMVFNERLPDVGVEIITSKSGKKERERLITDFRSKKIKILINVSVLMEGVDVPECSVVSLVRFFGSVMNYSQAVGRILRPMQNKRAILIDHAGNLAHGSVKNFTKWTDLFYQTFEEYTNEDQVKYLKELGLDFRPPKKYDIGINGDLVVYELTPVLELMVKASTMKTTDKMMRHLINYLKISRITYQDFENILDVCSMKLSREKAKKDLLPYVKFADRVHS